MAGGGRTIEADATSPGSRTAVWALLEDAGGIRVDVATIQPLTQVVVHIATGRPC